MVLRNHITDNVTIIILRLLCEYISIDRMSNWGFFSFITSNVLDHHNFQYGKKVGRDFSKKILSMYFWIWLEWSIQNHWIWCIHTHMIIIIQTHTHTHTHTLLSSPKYPLNMTKQWNQKNPSSWLWSCNTFIHLQQRTFEEISDSRIGVGNEPRHNSSFHES